MRIAGRRIRKRQLRKIGWIIIATVGTLALVVFSLAPALRVSVGSN